MQRPMIKIGAKKAALSKGTRLKGSGKELDWGYF